MNVVALVGRLTGDPEVRYSQDGLAIARWTTAVDRIKEGTDFISCNAFGKTAEFMEKYFKKGMKIGITGKIQTGSYTNKDGHKVYTTDVVAKEVEFCEKKADGSYETVKSPRTEDSDFMNIPEGIEDELPFK